MHWKIEIACIIREKLDPKHLGLHVHHRSVRVLKNLHYVPDEVLMDIDVLGLGMLHRILNHLDGISVVTENGSLCEVEAIN